MICCKQKNTSCHSSLFYVKHSILFLVIITSTSIIPGTISFSLPTNKNLVKRHDINVGELLCSKPQNKFRNLIKIDKSKASPMERIVLYGNSNSNDDQSSSSKEPIVDQSNNNNNNRKEKEDKIPINIKESKISESSDSWTETFQKFIDSQRLSSTKLPIEIQDTSLLYYDIFLLINLSVSISFWVVHRMSLMNITEAFNEGCLLCILWIICGLYTGAFLYSAADGHYDMTKEDNHDKGGPKAAGLLGLWTFVGTVNLRMVVALVTAVIDHRRVGIHGEELIPLELCFGLVLMSMWRMLHSTYSRV